ncbi:MAG: DMT family transporter [Pontixanthobacter sp.]
MNGASPTKASTRDSGTWPRWALLAALLLGNAALAVGPWSVRLADSGPVSAGFWRLALALPFLAMFAFANGERLGAVRGRTLMFVLLAGAAFGLDLASWHIGIEATRLGNATMFGNSGSLILMVWGFVVLRRLPIGGEWTAIAMAVIGATILLARSSAISSATVIGDMLCLLAGLFYAIYLLLLQRSRTTIGSWSLLFWASLAGAPIMLMLALMRGEPVLPTDWTPVLVLMVLSQLVGQGLLVFSLRHFTPLVIGLALLTQPAIAALTGWYAFGETIGAWDVLGMALLGLALVVAKDFGAKGNRSVRADPPDMPDITPT